MKAARGRIITGLMGTVLGAAGATPRHTRTRITEGPLYMPNELLLTFTETDARATLSHDDERVQTLLRRAADVAGGHGLRMIEKARPAGGQPAAQTQPVQGTTSAMARAPLTLRLHAPRPYVSTPRGDHIKRAADRINGRLDELQHRGIAVSSAMPNWILSSSNGGGGVHGGPGTSPDPAPDGDWTIEIPPAGAWLPPGMTEQTQGDAPNPPIVVAVLDTWPPGDVDSLPPYPSNRLLRQFEKHMKAGDVKIEPAFEPPGDVPPLRSSASVDHGLFVAGIVNSIAPHAEIRVLRLLDDRGWGRTDLLLDALDECLCLAQSGRRVVVNLSLYLRIPPEDELWTHWFGPFSRFFSRDPQHKAELLEQVDEDVERRITLLLDAGAVVVAAAGNDALFYRRHPQPRLPADYDTVLCVVATDQAGRIANYSNRADVPLTGNCVATYGGQGVLQRGSDGQEVAVVPSGRDPRDGVVGLYTQSDVATNEGPRRNATGWVYWSGTSFATPIISGIAANLLARNEQERKNDPTVRGLTPRGVMNQILAMAEPPQQTDAALGCPYVRATQQWTPTAPSIVPPAAPAYAPSPKGEDKIEEPGKVGSQADLTESPSKSPEAS